MAEGLRFGFLFLLRELRLGFLKLLSFVAAMTGLESIMKVSRERILA